MTDALRPVERELIDHVERGEVFDLAGDSPVDVDSMRSWDESRTIRASVVRDIMIGRLAPDADPLGIRLRGARISDHLNLGNVRTQVWLELYCCLIEEGMNARDARLAGVALSGCHLEYPGDVPLSASRLTATMVWINDGTSVEGDVSTAVDLTSARIDALDCRGARFRTADGPALDLYSARVAHDVQLCAGFEAVGAGEFGTIRMSELEIGGSLFLHEAVLRNDTGPALNAEGLRAGGDVRMGNGFDATGEVDLATAHVTGYLDCDGAVLRNDSGPALNGELLRVDRAVFCGNGFSATSSGQAGTVLLPGAKFGRFECTGKIHNDSGPALVADGLQVDQDLTLIGFEAVGGGAEDAVISLGEVVVRGSLRFAPAVLRHRSDQQRRLYVDGLSYRGVPYGLRHEEWLTLLREGTPFYAAQPYQYLAAEYRAVGDDREARRILMDQRRDQISRAMTGRAERAWARFTGLVLGYGYQPWRALLGLLVVLAGGAVLAVVLGGGGLVQVRAGVAPVACPVIDRIAVGLELGTPLISTPARIRCEATNTGAGQALTIVGWVLRLMAWAFATLFIAGFTGAVRKT
ncbi:hypothetical protein [Lentzea kentuckyensis]|uniref:hypothetical protein n=1 Tax=Lentzea kentuckyensis TaxID=360086 RepID=UPI000A3D0105|nr:hypothetical protein [Lentzea kentuckyensis]